jgi:hypothetical protein
MRILGSACLVLLLACGGDDDGGVGDGGASDAGADGGARNDAGVVDASSDAAPTALDCVGEALTKVFVLATELGTATPTSHLLRFDPETLTYTDIGVIRCETEGSFLRSMAVDRSGTAWVSSGRGALFRVSTTDASCTATGMELEQHQIRNYGMGFATVGTSSEERLFITAEGGWWMDGLAYRRLAAIDRSDLRIDMIGDIDAPTPANMELTGTGDGRLFGMVLDVRNLRNIVVSVELLDADTGGTIERKVVPLEARGGFAFAQWGGNFWLFTEAPGGEARAAEFDWESGEVLRTVDVALDVPGTIVGAGVSTCAPYDLI